MFDEIFMIVLVTVLQPMEDSLNNLLYNSNYYNYYNSKIITEFVAFPIFASLLSYLQLMGLKS
jgi:hypothetical protein